MAIGGKLGAIIAPKQYSSGEAVATSLGTGLAQLLQGKIEQRNRLAALRGIGIPEDEARQIAMASGRELPALLKSRTKQRQENLLREELLQERKQRDQGIPQGLEDLLAVSNMLPQEEEQQRGIGALQQQVSPTDFSASLLQGKLPESLIGEAPQSQVAQGLLQESAQREQAQEEERAAAAAAARKAKVLAERRLGLEGLGEDKFRPGVARREVLIRGGDIGAATRDERAARKEFITERREDEKESLKTTQKLRESASKARDILNNSKIQLKLSQSGAIQSASKSVLQDLAGKALGMSDAQITAFRNTGTNLFEKFNIQNFSGLKEDFGSRPTQWDAQRYEKGFGSLYQTPEGREAILKSMILRNEMILEKEKAWDEITAANGGFRPKDIEARVNRRLAPKRERAGIEYENIISDALVKSAKIPYSASGLKGRVVEAPDGLEFISDGTKWKFLLKDEE